VKLTLLQIGKTKDKWLLEGISEYRKRISAFAKFEIIELPDESIKHSGNAESVKTKEASTMLFCWMNKANKKIPLNLPIF